MSQFSDTIAAIATPEGQGGIAVIRVSGLASSDVVAARLALHKDPGSWTPNQVWLDTFNDLSGDPLDQVLVSYFAAPKSYSGEDIVEISCHGGRYLAGLILDCLLGGRIRIAEPGEFTKRAFVNGRLDLTQAEAVADLISAKTRESVRQAVRQLQGGVSLRIEACRKQMIALVASLELELDFSEEDLVLTPKPRLLAQIEKLQQDLLGLAQTYQKGRLIHDGVKITLAGKPNVGKSTLFNALLGYEKAIVDDSPGTTRDALEAQLDIEGLLFHLTDTAGLRQGAERVEKKGISITEKHLKETDLILFMLDKQTGFTDEDGAVKETLKSLQTQKPATSPEVLVLWNKADLANGKVETDGENGWQALDISAQTGQGFAELHRFLVAFVGHRDPGSESGGGAIITNLRHQKALMAAHAAMERSRGAIREGLSNEFAAVDIREGLNHLGIIIGKTTTDDVLDYVFAHFCIGK